MFRRIAALCAFTVLAAVCIPLCIVVAVVRALWVRIRFGTASQALDGWMEPYRNSMHYPCQMVLRRSLDVKRLETSLQAMAEEAGLKRDQWCVRVEKEAPRSFPTQSAIAGDHYVLQDGKSFFSDANIEKKVIWVRVWNGAEGQPTVVHGYLAAGSWDGSSCFNFMKELLHRTKGGARHDFFKGGKLTTMRPESRRAIDSYPFWKFMLRLPVCVFWNTFWMLWRVVHAARWAGGDGLGVCVSICNFDEADSAKLAKGAAKLGAKPFAAMTFAAVTAYRRVLKRDPYAIVQQASMMTRHYLPEMERDQTGDWLRYTLKDAQAGYDTLLRDLDTCGPSVQRAFYAKAFGIVHGGAGTCEVPPTYGDDSRSFRGIFFNNYGVRNVHPDAGFVSWNWGAPFEMGLNTIQVNGRTCICLCTFVLGQRTLDALRDQVEVELRKLMAQANDTE